VQSQPPSSLALVADRERSLFPSSRTATRNDACSNRDEDLYPCAGGPTHCAEPRSRRVRWLAPSPNPSRQSGAPRRRPDAGTSARPTPPRDLWERFESGSATDFCSMSTSALCQVSNRGLLALRMPLVAEARHVTELQEGPASIRIHRPRIMSGVRDMCHSPPTRTPTTRPGWIPHHDSSLARLVGEAQSQAPHPPREP
jgi:hypothetical protein